MATCDGDINVDALERIGTALADRTRRRLLVALARGPGYPAELAIELDETRQNISNHLACLRDCGLVVAEPEGRRMRYELVDPRLTVAMRELAELALIVDAGRPPHAEASR